MPQAVRGGAETYWRTWGEGAPRVLMLHCTLAHSGVWDGLAQRLDRPAIAFDAPGHGRSGPLDPAMDYQDQCLRVTEDFLTSEPMDIIGHSFAATVALRLALEQPEKVRRLVLIEPVLYSAARDRPDFDAQMAVMAPFYRAVASGDPMLAAERFTALWGTGAPWARMRADQQQALAERIMIIPTQMAALFEDKAGLLDPGRMEGLQTPVLLMEGAASPSIIASILDVFQDRLPNNTRRCIEGAGHMLPITHPEAAAAAIGPFLSA